jgi:hypothetical protein
MLHKHHRNERLRECRVLSPVSYRRGSRVSDKSKREKMFQFYLGPAQLAIEGSRSLPRALRPASLSRIGCQLVERRRHSCARRRAVVARFGMRAGENYRTPLRHLPKKIAWTYVQIPIESEPLSQSKLLSQKPVPT